jgi:hypothetical protein
MRAIYLPSLVEDSRVTKLAREKAARLVADGFQIFRMVGAGF